MVLHTQCDQALQPMEIRMQFLNQNNKKNNKIKPDIKFHSTVIKRFNYS